MDNETLIKRFLEETEYDKDEKMLFIIVYGSRITHTNGPGSDLDVLMVTSNYTSYKRAMLVDGIPIDITVWSLDDLQKNIHSSIIFRSSFYPSLLKNGIVVLDRINIFENIQNMIDVKVKRKNSLNVRIIEDVRYHINEFMIDYDDRHYFKALELLRRLHHVNANCSYIRFTKVYDLYTDKEKAHEQYMLKLPDEEYISTYLRALDETDNTKRLEYLNYFYQEFANAKFKELEEVYFMSEDNIRKSLYDIHGAVCKCEEMILDHHPYAKVLYFILLDEIENLYETLHSKSLDDLNIDFDSSTEDELIKHIERLFGILDKEYEIDYNDVILRL